jgi:serine/threonine-protein kinase
MTDERLPDVLRIFEAALSREGAARAAYLDAECGPDAALRSEVEALLAEPSAETLPPLEHPPWARPVVTVGQSLGPYVVVAPIGAGGMGEVYKARDTRLGRTVAIKVLPPGLAADPERRRRFEQEARAVAALSHPHICTIHDVGHAAEIDFLVMEHLDGQTLAHRLQRGALPIGEAIEIGIQIADALAAAHRAHIVHRDVKPGNVMLTRSGAKLLDFGLAKLKLEATEPGVGPAEGPPTQAGAMLGTVQYMAPEQLEGKEADARSDLFAFGAVLYEMVTGRRAFTGDNRASIIAAILNGEPPVPSSVRRGTPPALDDLIKACLNKNPDTRWDSAQTAAIELRRIAAELEAAGSPATAAQGWAWVRRRWTRGTALALIALGLAVGGFIGGRLRTAHSPSPAARAAISLVSAGLTLTGGGLAISPDGQTLVFAAQDRTGATHLYRRDMGDRTLQPLTGPEFSSPRAPFFSPDGQTVAFSDSGALYKVPTRGGQPPQKICDAQAFQYGTWDTDGEIIFTTNMRQDLFVVRAQPQAQPRLLLPRDSNPSKGWRLMWPQLLPDGEHVLCTVWDPRQMRIAVVSRRDGASQTLFAGLRARYLPASGHVFYELDGHLLARAFDPVRGRAGDALLVLAGLSPDPLRDQDIAVSANGTLVYGGLPEGPSQLVWKTRSGETQPLPLKRRRYSNPRLLADGKRFVDNLFESGSRRVWIGNVDREPMQPLTEAGAFYFGVPSPDGRYVAVTRNDLGINGISLVSTDGSRAFTSITSGSDVGETPTSWSASGGLLFINRIRGGPVDVALLAIDATGRLSGTRTVASDGGINTGACLSPDARFIAFLSDRASERRGDLKVFVQRYPSGAPVQVSLEVVEVSTPVWNPATRGGQELFYQGSDGVMSVRLIDGRPAGPPVRLFAHPLYYYDEARDWDVDPSGNRFLVVERPGPDRPSTEIDIVFNWFTELAAREKK